MTIESPVLTAREAAAYLKVARSFLTAHLSEISHTRAGRDLRFMAADLDAYLARGRKHPMVAAEPTPARRSAPPLRPRRDGINKVTGKPWGYYDAPRTEKAI